MPANGSSRELSGGSSIYAKGFVVGVGEWIELIESVAYNSGNGRDELESGDFMAKKPNIVLIMADQFR